MSILSSAASEKRWVLAMEKNFPQHHILDIDFETSVCVFRAPNTLTQEKPQAYAPQTLGLGPYHHLRPDLHTMHHQKLAAITKLLSPEKLPLIRRVVDALVQSEPLIRACYDHYLDLEIHTLAWILAIDALYLLQFLKNYPQLETLAADILMLENQIPSILLRQIGNILELADYEEETLAFLHDQSPLQLAESSMTVNTSYVHLLHRMYHMITNNCRPAKHPLVKRLELNDVVEGVQFLAEHGLPGAGAAGQVLSFINKIPWDKISGLFKQQAAEEQAQEIDIPSVSQMTQAAGIKFVLTDGGIRDIRIEEFGDGLRLYLPVVRLTATSEVVLRNLVAYEEASGSTRELAEYLDFMCGIIDSGRDVGILKMEKIVESQLADEEIARIFNGVRESMKNKDSKSNVEEVIEDVKTRYDNLASVKVKRFLAKYGVAVFKFMSVLISVAVVVLLILQAFCTVFGCTRWFGKSMMQRQFLFSYM